jgi:peptidoglycan/LPS O-acetylase OafA/YrhL
MKKITIFLNIIKPNHPLDWRIFLLISIAIWIASVLAINNDYVRNDLALLSLLILAIAIGIRTSEPPFIIGEIALSPWITAALLCLIIHQKTAMNRPDFAIKVWPIIAVCLIFIMEFIRDKFKIQSSPPLVRMGFLIVLLIHINLYCWIEFYLRAEKWLQTVPNIIPTPETLQPNSVKMNPVFPFYSFLERNQKSVNF